MDTSLTVMWLCGFMVGFGAAAILCTHLYWRAERVDTEP